MSEFSLTKRNELGFLLVIGVGMGVGLGTKLESKGVKTVARSIKLADGFMKGAKAIYKLHSPTPSNLLFVALTAAKALAKGASKGHIMKDKCARASFKRISKGLKASEGALNLVKYGRVLGLEDTDPWESVIKGFKLSKSAFNLFDGVNGVAAAAARGYGALKSGLDGVSVVVKALVLSKEMYGILIQGLGISHRALEVLMEEFKDNKKEKKALKVLLEEFKIGEEEEKPEENSWNATRKRRGIYRLRRRARVYSEKGLCVPSTNLLAASLVADQNSMQDLDCIFSLSIPCRLERVCWR